MGRRGLRVVAAGFCTGMHIGSSRSMAFAATPPLKTFLDMGLSISLDDLSSQSTFIGLFETGHNLKKRIPDLITLLIRYMSLLEVVQGSEDTLQVGLNGPLH